jgi:hypothetical protein
MASAVKKKLVVCGGNGFLGTSTTKHHQIELQKANPHTQEAASAKPPPTAAGP